MSNDTTENPGHDNMEVSALTVKEVIETEVDELSLGALVGEGQKLKVKNMIEMQVIDIVERPNGKKFIDGRWVLRRKRLVLVGESRASLEVVRADWRKRCQSSFRLITPEPWSPWVSSGVTQRCTRWSCMASTEV